VGKNDLSFGYGRHACPGRYLGHLNIKLILAEVLLRYDVKLSPGQERPQNDEFEAIVSRYALSNDSRRYLNLTNR
jgi:cytochrome P450